MLTAIREQAAPILGYFLSFFIIGGFWMMHQRVFRHMSKFNRESYWLNLQFLFFLSILPLTTSIHAGNHELRIGWWLYAGNVTIAGLGLLALWLRATRDSLLDKTVDHVVQAFYIWRLATIPLVFLVSILASFINVIAAQWVPLTVPLVFLGYPPSVFPAARVKCNRAGSGGLSTLEECRNRTSLSLSVQTSSP